MGGLTVSKCKYALAFETSGDLGSVALGIGDRIVEARPFSGLRRHAAEFLPTIEALCRTHSVLPEAVRYVHVSAGPGSFTGLRIGITAARLLALAHGARIVAVPTLEVIAQNALGLDEPPDQVVVILDAKRNHVYAATFELRHRRYVPSSEPAEVEPVAFIEQHNRNTAVMGDGVALHREALMSTGRAILPESFFPSKVETVFRLGVERARRGLLVEPRDLVPLYVRRPEAEEKWQMRHGPSHDAKGRPTPPGR